MSVCYHGISPAVYGLEKNTIKMEKILPFVFLSMLSYLLLEVLLESVEVETNFLTYSTAKGSKEKINIKVPRLYQGCTI